MATKLSTQLTKLYTDKDIIGAVENPLSGLACAVGEMTVLAADSDNDVYKLFEVPGNGIPTQMFIRNTAITGGSVFDFGLYEVGADGAAKDPDVLANNISLVSAATATVRSIPASTTNPVVGNLAFWQLAGDTEYKGQNYVVGVRGTTVGTVDGSAVITMYYKFSGN